MNRTSREKRLMIAGLCIVVFTLATIAVLISRAFASVDPYLIKPITTLAAPGGAKAGFVVNTNTRTLSVLSSNAVVVVADPGVSFQYEVLWLVERRRKGGASNLMEYTFELPPYATPKHRDATGRLSELL